MFAKRWSLPGGMDRVIYPNIVFVTSMARFTIDPTTVTPLGRITRLRGISATKHLLDLHRRLSLLQSCENTRPQLTRLSQEVGQTDIGHTRVVGACHGLELRDDVLESECLARRLGRAGF